MRRVVGESGTPTDGARGAFPSIAPVICAAAWLGKSPQVCRLGWLCSRIQRRKQACALQRLRLRKKTMRHWTSRHSQDEKISFAHSDSTKCINFRGRLSAGHHLVSTYRDIAVGAQNCTWLGCFGKKSTRGSRKRSTCSAGFFMKAYKGSNARSQFQKDSSKPRYSRTISVPNGAIG